MVASHDYEVEYLNCASTVLSTTKKENGTKRNCSEHFKSKDVLQGKIILISVFGS